MRDGAIVGDSPDGNPRNEFLATPKRGQNFVLRPGYRLVGTRGFVNGGVPFRSVRIAQPGNETSRCQADIGTGHSGCLCDESRRKNFLARAPDEQIKRLEKPGEWNRYEIRCEGPKTTITLNGETTVAYTETDPTVPHDSLITLQIHGNCSPKSRSATSPSTRSRSPDAAVVSQPPHKVHSKQSSTEKSPPRNP